MTYMDDAVQRTLAARVAADIDMDNEAAMAMVLDVAARGSDSPHAEVVGQAAAVILAPVIEVFSRFAASAINAFEKMGAALGPAFEAWIKAHGTPVS